MPRRLAYSLPDALRAAGYANLPEPADIARALRDGRLPWIERRDARWSFDMADLDQIAGAMGLKKLVPEPNEMPSGIAGVSAKFNELFR